MKIYKITEASEYLGVSINTLKTLANMGIPRHRRQQVRRRPTRQHGYGGAVKNGRSTGRINE